MGIVYYVLGIISLIVGIYGSTHKIDDPSVKSELCEFFGWLFTVVFIALLTCDVYVW
jgi:hypothetical protein